VKLPDKISRKSACKDRNFVDPYRRLHQISNQIDAAAPCWL